MWGKRPAGPNDLKVLQKACLNERIEAPERIWNASACRDFGAKSLTKRNNGVVRYGMAKGGTGLPNLAIFVGRISVAAVS